jgi:leucyl-tRNA synthetase
MGPLEASKPWNTRDIVGVNRFLKRVWRNFVDDDTEALLVDDTEPTGDHLRLLHKTIRRVTDDMERLSFNTATAALIEMNNKVMVGLETLPRALAEPFVLMLSPLAPHLSEELWRRMGHSRTLAYEPWPQADETYLKDDTVEIAVQVNGKVRASILVPADAAKDDILATARSNENITRYLKGKTMQREIYVPGRIVNLVVN